ncbi:MAG: type II toxin-antitoxin system RelE/ParE family toxin [Spirulinaceae cyanobacterium RM2_2_10]|nr:type II toxin-antitoxin system RelE/ParE family toxin [Spirulinaceae cyanobacterium SM2_1_0]NJO18893.1 type II toxin-antitoxin system RelE/ParE family toxin [Spirulinaceae cyanobacterium RM2_2_10]
MRDYIISPLAIQDLQAIVDYFATFSVPAGEAFLAKFAVWCQKLRGFPAIGKRYDGLRLGLRGVLIDDYIVFYRVTDEAIEIVRVVSGRRDLAALFDAGDA